MVEYGTRIDFHAADNISFPTPTHTWFESNEKSIPMVCSALFSDCCQSALVMVKL
jgi:hypothetical protein